jgi:hypothetical protein
MANLATITTNILADSGIDDINVVVSTGSYADPAWITSLAWTKITGAPANIVTGTGTVGQVAYWSSGSAITGEANLFWDATNDRLGIGTASPVTRLHIANSSSAVLFAQDGTTATIVGANAAGSSSQGLFLRGFPLTFTGNGGGSAAQMTLDSSGILGIGVTPSAWNLYKAIQVQNASISNFDNSDNSIVGSNVFYGGSPNDFRYISTGTSTVYRLNNSVHSWFIAPSGTAGAAIPFTQAMTLGSNSGLSIGTPSAAPAQGLLVQGETTLSSSLAVNGNKITLSSQEDIVSTNGILLGSGVSTIEMVASNFAAGYGAKIEQADPGDGFTYTRLFGRANSTSWTQNFQVNNSTGASTFSSSVTAGGDITSRTSLNAITLSNTEPYVFLARNSGSNGIGVIRTLDGGALAFDNGATGAAQSTKMTIFSDGNTFIGSSPSNAGYKLDVVGSFRTGANGMALDSNGFAVTPNASRPWNAFRYSHPQNIVPNGDLESWTSGTSTAPDGFGGYDLGGSTIITRESSIVKEGLYSAKISNPTGTAFSGMVYDGVRVDKTPSSSASSSYTISFWYLTPATNGSVSYIGVFDTASSSYSFIEQLPRAGVWVFYSRTFSIRDDSNWNVTWWVSWGGGTANDTLYVDSVALNKGNQIYNTTRSAVSTTGDVTRWGGFNNLGGNVGIGTTSPNSLLEVNRTITFSTVDTYAQLVVKTTSGATGRLLNIGVDEANNVSFIQSVNRGIDVMPLSLQRYGGNVLIGTATDAGVKLDVNGTGRFSGQLNGTSGLFNSFVQGTDIYASYGSQGYIALRAGGAGAAGFMEIFSNNGTTRLGYIGYNTTNLLYQAENGASHVFQGGAATFSSSVTAASGTFTNGVNSISNVTIGSGGGFGVSNSTTLTLNTPNGGGQIAPAFIDYKSNGTTVWKAGITSTNNAQVFYRISNATSDILTINSTGAATFSSSLETNGKLVITADAGNEQLLIRRATNANQQLIFGYHSDGYGRIQAVEQDVAFRPLSLNQSGGNVLIGTTDNPGFTLNVNGTGRFSDRLLINSTTNYSALQNTNTSGNIYWGIDNSTGSDFTGVSYARFIYSEGAYPLITYVNGAERMRIASTGAATFSSSAFNVATFNSTFGQMAISFANSGTTFSQIGSGISVCSTAAIDDLGLGTAGFNKNIVFATGTGFTERMRITSGGNVGIGTNSPGVKFVNSGGNNASLPTFGSGTIGSDAILSANGFYGLYTGVASEGHVWQQVQRNDGSTAVYPLVLQPSGGNVLIGTTTDPGINRVLSVERNQNGVSSTAMINSNTGNSASAQFIISANNSSGFYGAFSSTHATANWAGRSVFGTNALGGGITISAHNASQDIRFLTESTSNIRMVIASNGNVLIGTTGLIGPVQGKLDVQYDGVTHYGMNLRTTSSGGGLAISFNNSSGSQVGSINTTFSATSYNTSSDYRLKTDLKDFNGIDIINKIKTYDFKWKSENSRSYGVIAHELQEVIDYVVHGEKDSVTMQAVDYSKLVPIMVKAIQEQQVQIQQLKNKLS